MSVRDRISVRDKMSVRGKLSLRDSMSVRDKPFLRRIMSVKGKSSPKGKMVIVYVRVCVCNKSTMPIVSPNCASKTRLTHY